MVIQKDMATLSTSTDSVNKSKFNKFPHAFQKPLTVFTSLSGDQISMKRPINTVLLH
jgi:hypothetical protein